MGHFRNVCKTTKRQPKTKAAATALVAEAHLTSQPQLEVQVAVPCNANQHSVLAVADTGAQVCVAGRQLINDLDLSRLGLQHPGMPIKHVAGGYLHVLESSTYTFSAPLNHTYSSPRASNSCIYR